MPETKGVRDPLTQGRPGLTHTRLLILSTKPRASRTNSPARGPVCMQRLRLHGRPTADTYLRTQGVNSLSIARSGALCADAPIRRWFGAFIDSHYATTMRRRRTDLGKEGGWSTRTPSTPLRTRGIRKHRALQLQTAVGQEIRWTGHLSNGSLMEDWTGVQTAVGQEIRWKTERRRLSDAEDKPPTSLQPCLLVRYFRPTAVPRHDSREQDQQHHNRVACA